MNTKLIALLIVALLGLAATTEAASSHLRRVTHRAPEEESEDATPDDADESGAEESSEDAEEESSEQSATPLKGGCQGSSDECQQVKIVGQDGNSDSASSVNDAVQPVADWLKAFKKRTEGSGDLASAAEAMAKPIVDNLKMKQQAMIEKLQASNQEILTHVSQSVTEHALKLLRSDSIAAEAQEKKEEKAEAKVEAAAAVEDAKVKAAAAQA